MKKPLKVKSHLPKNKWSKQLSSRLIKEIILVPVAKVAVNTKPSVVSYYFLPFEAKELP